MSVRNLFYLNVFVLLACAASSCLKNEDNTPSGPKAGLSVSNYIVNAGGIRVTFDDNPVSANELSFGSTTDSGGNSYLRVPAGIHNIKLRSGTETVLDKNIALKASSNYSLFVYDTLKANLAKILLLEDEQAIDTVAKARFLHFIPGGDTMTLVIIKDTTGLAVSDTYIGTQSEPESNSGFTIIMKPAVYRLQLARGNTIIYQLNALTVQAGKQYSFVATGRSGGTGVYKEMITVIEHD